MKYLFPVLMLAPFSAPNWAIEPSSVVIAGFYNSFQSAKLACEANINKCLSASFPDPNASMAGYRWAQADDIWNDISGVKNKGCNYFSAGFYANCVEYHYYGYSGGCPASQPPDASGKCTPNYDEKKQAGTTDCPQGNPINIGIANKYQIETDFTGSGVFPLAVVRTYNSITGDWRFLPEIKPNENLNEVVVIRSDGKELSFVADGLGGWASDADVTGVLEGLTDGQGTLVSWRFTTLDGQVENYTLEGTLTQVTRRSGISHAYAHTPTDITVTHANGQTLVYHLNSSGQIVGFTDSDNNMYSYNYNAYGRLLSLTYPNSGGSRLYHYEEGTWSFPQALTGITDANGDRFATWDYDAFRRAILSEHNNGSERVTVDYSYANDATDPRVTTTNALGKQTTYHFATIHGVRKVVQVEGHPSTNCAAANKTYTYDANGFLASKTDWKGNTTTYVRNAKGQELSRAEAVGTAEERTITTEWHSTFNLPLKITEPGRETTFTYDANGNQTGKQIVDISGS